MPFVTFKPHIWTFIKMCLPPSDSPLFTGVRSKRVNLVNFEFCPWKGSPFLPFSSPLLYRFRRFSLGGPTLSRFWRRRASQTLRFESKRLCDTQGTTSSHQVEVEKKKSGNIGGSDRLQAGWKDHWAQGREAHCARAGTKSTTRAPLCVNLILIIKEVGSHYIVFW